MEAFSDFLKLFETGASAGIYAILFLFWRLEKRIFHLELMQKVHADKLSGCPIKVHNEPITHPHNLLHPEGGK